MRSTRLCPNRGTDNRGSFFRSGSTAHLLSALISTVFAVIVFLSPETGRAARFAGEAQPVPTALSQSIAQNGASTKTVPPPAQAPVQGSAEAAPMNTGGATLPPLLQQPQSQPALPPQPPQPRQVAASPQEGRDVSINFENVDFSVFVKFVSQLTGPNFVIDERVRGKVTVISPRKIAIDEVYKVFESVLEIYGLAAVSAGDIIKIVPALTAREKQLETKVTHEGKAGEDKLITQIITLENANPNEVKRVLDPLVSRSSVVLSYPPTGILVITDYQSNIQKIMEIIGALDVAGVAAQISYIPLKAALAADIVKHLTALFPAQLGRAGFPIKIVADDRANAIILVASEMDSERIKKLLILMDKDVSRGSAKLRVYRLQNAGAEDLAKVLMNIPKAAVGAPAIPGQLASPVAGGRSPLLSKDVQIVADKATNMLIITATSDDYKILDDVIKSLDVSRPMVFIEALIMEVQVTKDFRVGVEWRGIKDTGSLSGFDTGQGVAILGSGGLGAGPSPGGYDIIPGTPAIGAPLSFPSGFSLGYLGAGITVGGIMFPNIGAVLRAYQKDSDVSVLSTPQLMTFDNEEAEITVGKNVPYIIRQDNTSGITTGINYSSYEYKDVGMTLHITPHINEEGHVRLKLNQKLSNVIAEQSTTGLPTTTKRETKTIVVVKDKETIVIGGLIGDTTSAGTYQVPCLGNIPLFGGLFKSMSRNRDKTNLYVFLTPHIIRTASDAADLYTAKREQMGVVEEGIIKLNEKRTLQKPQNDRKER